MAFQCRKVWKVIFKSLGFCRRYARRFFIFTYVAFVDRIEPFPKSLMLVLGSRLSIAIRVGDTLNILAR